MVEAIQLSSSVVLKLGVRLVRLKLAGSERRVNDVTALIVCRDLERLISPPVNTQVETEAWEKRFRSLQYKGAWDRPLGSRGSDAIAASGG